MTCDLKQWDNKWTCWQSLERPCTDKETILRKGKWLFSYITNMASKGDLSCFGLFWSHMDEVYAVNQVCHFKNTGSRDFSCLFLCVFNESPRGWKIWPASTIKESTDNVFFTKSELNVSTLVIQQTLTNIVVKMFNLSLLGQVRLV